MSDPSLQLRSAESIKYGLLAARSSEAISRAEAQQALSREDQDILGEAEEFLKQVAEGAAFIRDFRQRGANCPIVMVTANSDPNVHRRAYAAGAAHVFANGDYAFATYFRQALRESAL